MRVTAAFAAGLGFARVNAAIGPTPAAAAGPEPRGAAAVADRKGLNGNELHALAPERLRATVDRCMALGVQWVRFDFDWSVIQPEPDAWHFAGHDAAVDALRAAGIQVLGIIDYSPPWARRGGAPSKFHPPSDPKRYARFAATLAARYAPRGVHAWEIWNEPNLGQFWAPAPDPAAYAALLGAACPAIREADPAAIVITGGLAQAGPGATSMRAIDFLAGVYRQRAGGCFDAVGNHPYSSPAMPDGPGSSNWRKMSEGRNSMRELMTSNGDAHKPIWITEFGAPTEGVDRWGTVVREEAQAEMLQQAYRAAAAAPWSGPVFWYNLQDFCPPDRTRSAECYYGLLRHDGTEKPAAAAYRQAPATLRRDRT